MKTEWARLPIYFRDNPGKLVELVGYYELCPDINPSSISVEIVVSVDAEECRYKIYNRKLFGDTIPNSDDILAHHMPFLHKVAMKYQKLSYSAFHTKFDLLKSKL